MEFEVIYLLLSLIIRNNLNSRAELFHPELMELLWSGVEPCQTRPKCGGHFTNWIHLFLRVFWMQLMSIQNSTLGNGSPSRPRENLFISIPANTCGRACLPLSRNLLFIPMGESDSVENVIFKSNANWLYQINII